MIDAHPLLDPTVFAERGLEVTDPATEERLATVKAYSVEEARTAAENAQAAGRDWAKLPAKSRSQYLRRWFELIEAHKDDIAALITAESGKPLAEARGEVAYGASFIEWFGEEAKRVYGDVIPGPAEDKRILVTRQPVGVCAAITPWNFPLAMLTRKAGPALAAGCTMLVKPAEATPLTALAVEKLARDAGIPADAFRVLPTTDPAAMGEFFCTSEIIRKLSFTGSTEVGRLLMRQSADNVKKLSLELGGNAPFIVFDDADLDAAVEGAIASKFRNAGQTCVCANRFLVQDGIYDQFAEKLSARVADLKVGDGRAAGVTIGPLINADASDKVERLVGDALAAGASCTLGGKALDRTGHFFAPTVLTEVSPTMSIANEEIFGPVVTLIRFPEIDDAIRLANDTIFGLSAYFYTQSHRTVWRTMEGLDYGIVGINEGIISNEAAPFGGMKQSGIGREGSKYGIDEYTELKYALVGGL